MEGIPGREGEGVIHNANIQMHSNTANKRYWICCIRINLHICIMV